MLFTKGPWNFHVVHPFIFIQSALDLERRGDKFTRKLDINAAMSGLLRAYLYWTIPTAIDIFMAVPLVSYFCLR